jgi:eukaryotic-like serine/threonine-protein kinase
MGTGVMIGEPFDGRYRLERRLGHGGMADVYLATDESLGRHVAIKILSDRYAQDDGFVERFRREASAAAGLNHQNIVAVYDRGEAEGTYYIAMEFLDGPTLKDEIVRRAPLPEAEAVNWATQALDALDYAHKRGIVHRDVKPHNMVLTEEGRLKVTDFGIARAQNTQQMTEVGSIVGTAQYLSPEQARGLPVGPQSDLYSMGIVLYEMLTGELPFTGDGAVDIAMKQVSDTPPSLRERNRLVSTGVEQVVMRALAKDPALRHPSARAMADELRRVSRGGPVSQDTHQATAVIAAYTGAAEATPTSVIAAPPPAAPTGPKRSAMPWILVILLLAASAAIGFIVYQQLQGSSGVTIPASIRGESCGQATAELHTLGFTVKSCHQDTASKTVPKGDVVSASPALGSSAAKGTPIVLHASSGPNSIALPDLSGHPETDAIGTITGLGFPQPQIVNINSPKQPAQDVVLTKPGPGSYPPDKQITLYVATGYVIIPSDLTGESCQVASQELTALTLNPTCTQQADPNVPKGQVIGVQNETPGQPVKQHSPVTVLVSSGPGNVGVPNVVGELQSDARAQLKADHFVVQFTRDLTCDQSQDGIVEAQNPLGNTQAPYGSTVTLTVYKYDPSNPNCSGGPTT